MYVRMKKHMYTRIYIYICVCVLPNVPFSL